MPVISWLCANLSSYLIAFQISDNLPKENVILLCFWRGFDNNKCSVFVNSDAVAGSGGGDGDGDDTAGGGSDGTDAVDAW